MALTVAAAAGDVVQSTEKPNAPQKMDKREKPMTKVIVRRLPPSMSQKEFLEQVSPVPDHNYIYSVKGDMSLGEHAFSRVYVNFASADDIYDFKEKFDNYVFVDTKGHEYPAVVEFAAFQKIPKRRNNNNKNRIDQKCATIESDPIYLEFLESLNAQPTAAEEKPEFSYQPSNESGNKTDGSTPLLEFLKQQKLHRLKVREEKREERKKKDIERKRQKEEERRRKLEEKSPTKVISKPSKLEDIREDKDGHDKKERRDSELHKEKDEKTHSIKSRSKKYEERKQANSYKNKFSRGESGYEKKEFKGRKDDAKDRDHREREFRNKNHDDSKQQPANTAASSQKKVKKYSERREERKSALKKQDEKAANKEGTATTSAETDKNDEEMVVVTNKAGDTANNNSNYAKEKGKDDTSEPIRTTKHKERSRGHAEMSRRTSDSDNERESKNKENDPRLQRRIRNKDRPTMAIYKPGMLRRKVSNGDEKDKDGHSARSGDDNNGNNGNKATVGEKDQTDTGD